MAKQRLKIQFMHATAGSASADYPWAELTDALREVEAEDRPKLVGSGNMHPVTVEISDVGGHTLLGFHRAQFGKTISEWRQGEIERRQYPEDEGPTDATHLLHLEGRIFALVQEPGGPNRHEISSYLGVQAGLEYELHLVPVARADARKILKGVEQAPTIDLTIATSEIPKLREGSSWRKTFTAANEHVLSDEIRIRYKVKRKDVARKQWWGRQRNSIDAMIESGDIQRFSAAKVGTQDLLEQVVTAGSYIEVNSGSVESDVVVAQIWSSYKEKRNEVRDALGLE